MKSTTHTKGKFAGGLMRAIGPWQIMLTGVLLAVFMATAHAGPREQAKRIHDRHEHGHECESLRGEADRDAHDEDHRAVDQHGAASFGDDHAALKNSESSPIKLAVCRRPCT